MYSIHITNAPFTYLNEPVAKIYTAWIADWP
jgi:hypothetical protein